jgi:4-amino-4-deoxy-L-arabinose transferase-like glycosyltransferase
VVVLTCLSGTLLILPLAGLGRRLGGDTGGAATAWVAALAPGLATLPAARGAGSEAEYTLLIATATWFAVTAWDHRGRALWWRAAASGLLIGLAYLTRPEGLFLAVPLAAAILAAATRATPVPRSLSAAAAPIPAPSFVARLGALGSTRAIAAGAAFALPLIVCIVPYAVFLHSHTGHWQLTAKTQDASIEAWHAVARSDRGDRDKVLYALDDSGLRFAATHSSLPALAAEDPVGYAGILGTNVRVLGKNVGGWWLLPLPVWGLAAVGAWRLRRARTTRLLGAIAAVPVATALAFFVQPRYLVVTAACAAVLAGAAVTTLSVSRRRLALGVGAALLVASSVGAFYGVGGWWHPGDLSDQRAAGEWLAAHTDPGERILTRSMVVAFYAERTAVAIPYADLDQIVRFARHYGASYLVLDWYTAMRLRPQLTGLYTEPGSAPGLREVHTASAEGRTTRIFALDPAPPPTDEVGPSLSFMGDGA